MRGVPDRQRSGARLPRGRPLDEVVVVDTLGVLERLGSPVPHEMQPAKKKGKARVSIPEGHDLRSLRKEEVVRDSADRVADPVEVLAGDVRISQNGIRGRVRLDSAPSSPRRRVVEHSVDVGVRNGGPSS
ncbi:hypothetical protein V6N11_027730 [Hibiscus sabdariffa]|uniref:Uncharacterized protein n=1 Tax=Hibiscus sabdariffa TaxID=183260 RepID=A0ABR1ZVQ5_9ROSI